MTSEIALIRGHWVLTGSTVLVDGAVAYEGDTIIAVDSWAKLRAAYPTAAVLGSDQTVVMPGLINAHHHSNGVPHSLQGVDDSFLELWLFANLGLRSQDLTLKTLLSTAQLLQSGVTTVVDVTTIGGTAATANDSLKARLKAYEQAGMRVALTPGATYDSFLAHHEDAAFLASLPPALQAQVKSLIPLAQTLPPGDYLELIRELAIAYKDHPHIDIWFGPPGPQWVSESLLIDIAAAAAAVDTQIQTHAVESFHEKLMGPRFYGKSVIAHLQDLGVLSPRFSIAHGVWVSEADIEILATTGAAVSHNPSSNLRLRAGVAPLNAMLGAGVTVGLGMDGFALGDDEDMLAEMRLAARLHRTPQFHTPAPSYQDIFHLATAGSAKLMGKAGQIGQLAPGYKADVVLLKRDRLVWPWIAPEADPFDVVFLRAKAQDVDTVLVNGRVVLQDGMPTGFDLRAVGQAIADELAQTGDRAEYRALVAAVMPHLHDWYAQWEVPPLGAYAAFNSRD